MGYDDNYSPFTAAPPKIQPTRAPLWRLTKGSRTVDVSLLVHAGGAVEVQVFTDGEIFQGRRCASRALAEQYAAKLLDAHRQQGWVSVLGSSFSVLGPPSDCVLPARACCAPGTTDQERTRNEGPRTKA